MPELSRRRAVSIELAVLVMWTVLPAVFRAFSPSDTRRTGHAAPTYIYDTLYRVGEIGIIAFILWSSGDRWDSFGIRKVRPARDIPVGLVIAAIVVGTQWPMMRFYETYRDSVPGLFTATPAIAALSVLYIAVNICYHEVLYRGAFVTRIEELTGNRWWGVALSAAMFSLVVGQGEAQYVALYLGVGLMFGIAYVLTDSLWPALIGQLLAYVVGAYYLKRF